MHNLNKIIMHLNLTNPLCINLDNLRKSLYMTISNEFNSTSLLSMYPGPNMLQRLENKTKDATVSLHCEF